MLYSTFDEPRRVVQVTDMAVERERMAEQGKRVLFVDSLDSRAHHATTCWR